MWRVERVVTIGQTMCTIKGFNRECKTRGDRLFTSDYDDCIAVVMTGE